MSSRLAPPIRGLYALISKDTNQNIQQHHRNVLRSKENTYKHKCRKILKRKLKKYKLRHDGTEDQDVIDVSETLISSLFIRSPNKTKDSVELELESLKPKNYLSRMVRRKQTTLKTHEAKGSRSSGVGQNELTNEGVLLLSADTEVKKQTNAFKLLMDSRNKSLGSNSPGKEKPNDEMDMQDFVEKKEIKAKRYLMLQKMAEDKGSLKKAEIEEQHEKYIKKKMEKRAEKLKSMIMNKELKTVKNEIKKQSNLSPEKVCSPLDKINTKINDKFIDKKPIETLQLVNIFDETGENKSPVKKHILKEDEEFLKKLSPSIRKKESMLSYFKKIEKEMDSSLADSENDNVLIKVKLSSKPRKKGRKKKSNLNKDTSSLCDRADQTNVIPDVIAANDEVIEVIDKMVHQNENLLKDDRVYVGKERRKRKRDIKENTQSNDCILTNINSTTTDDSRPKRNLRKPVKYNDEVILSSSDEELHIFTPKKKKHSINGNNTTPKLINQNIKRKSSTEKEFKKSAMDQTKNCMKIKKPTGVNSPKPTKLAPIFTKSQPDPAIEAKQKFLQSGVPEQLKKFMSKQKGNNSLSNDFPVLVHVQQLNTVLPVFPELNLNDEICLEEIGIAKSEEKPFSKILDLSIPQSQIAVHNKNNANTQTILQNLKDMYPRFPVYRTYKLLRGKKKGEFKDSKFYSHLDNSIEILNCSIDMQNDNPDQLTWSDKYKPLSGNEIIGNFESTKELKKWLVTWTENDTKSKTSRANDSDSSDYYQSEPDSRDSLKSNNNLLILSGPVGTGKTSCVYAVAAELSIKVIEVNASSKRSGKIMLQDLQEATQSHKVNRGTGSNENSQKSQETVEFIPEGKKRGRPKKVVEEVTTQKSKKKDKTDVINGTPASQESTRTAMSLILIDDADIVFDQDDGFCSAIMQLVQSSKRPVILITGTLSLPHLQRFLQSGKIVKMRPLLPNMLGTWLDLMCLADSGTCWPGLGAKFLNFFKGDMRKTINCLQFYMGTQDQILGTKRTQTDSQTSDIEKLNADDENSCNSWADRDTYDDKYDNETCETDLQTVWNTFVNEYVHQQCMKYPLKMFNLWWSLPKILYKEEPSLDSNIKTVNVETNKENGKLLESIANVMDTISVCDYYGRIKPETEVNLTSHPWYDSESNSASELENFDNYDRKYDINNELSYELVKGSITAAQENMDLEKKFHLDFPGMSVIRQKDRIVSRHTNLTSYLSPQSLLDRKALALDYWSSCRTICRIEKSKTDSNLKRKNRFCHYLKSLSVLCKNDTFDNLANSLKTSN